MCIIRVSLDRDLNAAVNILGVGCPEVKPVETGALASAYAEVKLPSVKREINIKV